MSSTHFWGGQSAAALQVTKIAEHSPNREDVLWHAWNGITGFYLPTHAAIPGDAMYMVQQQATDPNTNKPDIVVVRIETAQQQGPRKSWPFTERDILWIECRASVKDVPSGWEEVLRDIVKRLHVVQAGRKVYFVLAVGLKWLPFLWDPAENNAAGTPLRMLKEDGDKWEIDPRVHVVDEAKLPGQRHVKSQDAALVVDTESAYTLNFWDKGNLEDGKPEYIADLELLEGFLVLVKETWFQGVNPDNY